MHAHDEEHVLEVGADVLGGEGQSPWLLEDDGDYVVPNVPLPQELQDRKHEHVNDQPLSRQSQIDEVIITKD